MRTAAPTSFVDVLLNIGTLPAGKSVTIIFNVTVDNPYLGANNFVENQGTVSGSNFSPVSTDDPDTGAAGDATVTPVFLGTPPDISCPADITVNANCPGTVATPISEHIHLANETSSMSLKAEKSAST